MVHYARMELRDGQLVATDERIIPQGQLTADCLLVQFRGFEACAECDVFGSPDCGGGKTLWAMILEERGDPPVGFWALQDTSPDVSALQIATGNISNDWRRMASDIFRYAWAWYKRKIRDMRECALAQNGSQELPPELVARLKPHVGKAAMVAGHRSNTFGAIVCDHVAGIGPQLYILSLNTRTFRRVRPLPGRGPKELRLPWLTPTSADALQDALDNPYNSRHLRIYWGQTNAPTERARKWAEEQGYSLIV